MPSQEVKKKETIIEHLKHTIQASSIVTSSPPLLPDADGAAAPSLLPPSVTTNPTVTLSRGAVSSSDYAAAAVGATQDRQEEDTLHEWSDAENRGRITENLRRALSVNDRTNRAGYETVAVLGRQKEVLHHTLENVGETRENLVEARRNIRRIRLGVYKEYLWKGLTIFLLVLWLCLLIYLKFIRRRR